MEFRKNYKLEDYLINTKWNDLPAEVKDRAIVTSIDLLMALILGIHGEQFQNGVRLAAHMIPGDIRIPGYGGNFGFLGAATAIGHASNSFDIDDGHNMIKGHPGTSFIGGVLAAGLMKDISYEEYLTTLVVSYDAAVRNGLAVQDHYHFLHSTGTYGAFATAAGAGRILGFDRDRMNTALSMADFHAPMTPVMRSVSYPSMSKDGVPFGAMVGALCVLDTLAGETALTHTLEDPAYEELLNSLGKTYEILNLYFKPYTCCRWAHQPVQASIELMKAEDIRPEEIDHVTVHSFASACALSKIVPKDTDEAQYNIAYPVAAAIVHGDVGFSQISNEALRDSRVPAMMERLSFEVDPAMEKEFPAKRLAWVEMKLNDGRNFRTKVYAANGEASDHVDLIWETAKFNRITSPFLTPEGQDKMLRLLTDVSHPSLVKLMDEVTNLLEKYKPE